MACSKLFSGDLPEITNEILQYLHDDYSTLYSCALVSRLWCRLAMPLLWEDPFSISKYNKHLRHHFIDFYLHFLSEAEKNVLREVFGIDRIDLISETNNPPLFNYPHFIKALNTYKLDLIAADWIDTFTIQSSKLHRKKGNSLYCNLPQPVMVHSLQLQNMQRASRLLLNQNESLLRKSSPSTSFEFPPLPLSSKSGSGNIRQDFQNKILPPPSFSTSQKRRGLYNSSSLPYPLPVDFKTLKREKEKEIEIQRPQRLSRAIRSTFPPLLTTSPMPSPRRSRRIPHRQPMIPLNLISVGTTQPSFIANMIPQDEKIEKSIKLKRFICCALIKLFISHSASLNTFEIIIDYKTTKHDYNFIYDVFEMIKSNPKFITSVENFIFHYSPPTHYIISNRITESTMEILPLITYLPSLCSLIKNLKIQVQSNISPEASKNLANFIGSQRQLSKLTFAFNKEFLQDSLSILKSVAQFLTCLIFDSCQFVNIRSFQGLECLENLESLQFLQCYPALKLELVQHLSKIANLKIKTLAIVNNNLNLRLILDESDNIQFHHQLLFLKIGSHLENLILSIDHDIKKDIFQNIMHFCERIKYIHFTELNHDNIPKLKNLLLHFGTTLRYLTLDIKRDNSYTRIPFRRMLYMEEDLSQNMKYTSIHLLQQLGQVLPSTLEYIDLLLILDPTNLKIFLDNCNHLKLKRLLFRNLREFYLDNTLQLLKDFIIKMSSIQFLSYRIGRGVDSLEWDLGGSGLKEKEKAKEFEPYVKVKKYSEVVVRMSEPMCNESIGTYML